MDQILKTVQVTLYHFSGWLDCDIPQTAEQLEGFNTVLRDLVTFYVSAQQGSNPRAIVHCRGGHGRTGTFTLMLARILQRFYDTFNQISQSNTLVALR